MNWLVLLIAFAVGAAVASAAARRFRRTAQGWGRARRVCVAAALLPGAMFALFLLGALWAFATLKEGGEGGREITVFAFALVLVVLGVPALLGGLVGAGIAERAPQR